MLVPNRINHVSAKVIDRAGNSGGCELLTSIVHDDEAPQVAALSPTTVGALDGPQSGPATFDVAGCAEADSTITLYSNDSCSGPVAILDTESDVAGCDTPGTGGWTAALSVAANATTAFWMEVVDQAGNSSGCVALGSYTHDDVAPAAPVTSSIRGTSWGVGVATFAIEGAGEAAGMVELFGDAACTNALGEGVVEADGRWHADITAFATTPTLYGRQIDAAGNGGACAELGEMFRPGVVRAHVAWRAAHQGDNRHQRTRWLPAGRGRDRRRWPRRSDHRRGLRRDHGHALHLLG